MKIIKKVKSVFHDLFDQEEADRLEMIAQHIDKKAKTQPERQKLWKRLKTLHIKKP